ncbi:conserved protein of unknown function [Methylocella tundrae]|uniref:N-acetyltransferase domain-containing protein n=2 Tax=Methylocella tundrae TaxID=227605 RepID=A0A4U8Z5N8_METTU|nr:conserved protein of unknown function [Methylocella tundrae]
MDAKGKAMSLGAIEIIPVNGLTAFLSFCRLPRQIYKGQSGFAPPLDAERWTVHGSKLNPHFKQVDWQAWIARKDGKPAGRIMAQIYKKDTPAPVGASTAQFGCLDAVDDPAVVEALTRTAEKWLRERGATVVHGPFSPSVNGEVGLLVQGFDAAPMVLMPWNPPYLVEAIEKLGYLKARDLISYRYDVTAKDRQAKAGILDRPEWRDRLKIRTLDLKKLGDEAAIIVDIFNDASSENWGFVPFTLEEFMSAADGLKLVMPPEGGFMIELDGTPQAFGIVLPNLHEITADLGGRLFPFGLPRIISRIRNHAFKSGRLCLFGVRRALQRKAAGGAVILAFIEEIRQRSAKSSIEHVEFGWVLEDNVGMRRPIEFAGARIDKIHRVYEKKLTA